MEQGSVLFVCLGNICRSPLAEGVFRQIVEAAGEAARWRIDSAGTGAWHIGEPPHRASIAVAARAGIDIAGQRARQVRTDDLMTFDYILAMDRTNLRDLHALAPRRFRARLHRLLEFAPGSPTLDVPDPFWGGPEEFERVFELIASGCRGLFDHLREEVGWSGQR